MRLLFQLFLLDLCRKEKDTLAAVVDNRDAKGWILVTHAFPFRSFLEMPGKEASVSSPETF